MAERRQPLRYGHGAYCRYLVFVPDYNGLGNRFRSLLSWYLLAVLVTPHRAAVPRSTES